MSVPPRVWKFAVPMPDEDGRSFVDMPLAVEPLSVGLQDDALFVWALVQPGEHEPHEEANGPRQFIVANTGMEIPRFPEGARFLGTVTTSNGIVWHVLDGDAETTA